MLLLSGCGGGPARYDIAGTANCDGKPIPFGTLIFNADNKSGNSGPQGRADIRDGKILMQPGMGCVGGPQWLQITAFDGIAYDDREGKVLEGRPIFPMAYKQLELPRDDVILAINATSKGRDQEPELNVDVEQ
jgi:hypothetical protein